MVSDPGHTDIVNTGWIARLPEAVRPYAILARLDRPVGVWLLFLPGAWSVALAPGCGGGKAAAPAAPLAYEEPSDPDG
ncbi:MAG TPA: hypothetical protein PKX87_08595, partial [Alphaproteobacteria bacterium]|nr:hypothetical protein [Alphaproteobacteria bacterium]